MATGYMTVRVTTSWSTAVDAPGRNGDRPLVRSEKTSWSTATATATLDRTGYQAPATGASGNGRGQDRWGRGGEDQLVSGSDKDRTGQG